MFDAINARGRLISAIVKVAAINMLRIERLVSQAHCGDVYSTHGSWPVNTYRVIEQADHFNLLSKSALSKSNWLQSNIKV